MAVTMVVVTMGIVAVVVMVGIRILVAVLCLGWGRAGAQDHRGPRSVTPTNVPEYRRRQQAVQVWSQWNQPPGAIYDPNQVNRPGAMRPPAGAPAPGTG